MPNLRKAEVVETLRQRFGDVRKVKGSDSLFIVGNEAAHIYFRYSKVHPRGRTFFGLRQVDLRKLGGHNAFLCFLLDDGSPPLFVPYADFEEVFHNAQPATDGQYKVQLYTRHDTRELYVAQQGRFNVEGYVGFDTLERSIDGRQLREARDLTHCQVQTLLAGIGYIKGYEVWIPENNIGKLDWRLTKRFTLRSELPTGFERIRAILSEIDVVWVAAGRNSIEGLYEVERSEERRVGKECRL